MQSSSSRRTRSATQALVDAPHRRPSPRAWARPAALSLIAVTALGVLAPSAAHAAAPERVFELVTPVKKGGSDISTGYRSTADGNTVGFESYSVLGEPESAAFASSYVARRSASGWQTEARNPRIATENPYLPWSPFLLGVSEDLSTTFVGTYAPLTADDQNDQLDVTAVSGGTTTWLNPALAMPDTATDETAYVGSSDDGRFAFLKTTKQLVAGVPGGANQVYRHGPDGIELVSRLPAGGPSAGAQLGNGRSSLYIAVQPDRHAVSADGQTAFFTTTSGVRQLYVNKGGVTKLVSADTNGAPGTAASTYWAATPDGSRVIFSSTSQLTAGAPVGGGLYAYDVASAQLRLLYAGNVRSVMRVSPDGKRVYAVSTAQLVPGPAVPTGPKLYLVTDSGVRFVGALDANANESWEQGEGGNVGGGTPDGRRIVFSTKTKLTAADNNGKTAVYRYDAEADAITCLSCRPDGAPSQGQASFRDASEFSTGSTFSRAITDDGRLTVFESTEGLLPEDTNGLSDVYGYDDDGLHLVSSGKVDEEAHVVDVSADGRDLFFLTNASLAADDIDHGYRDIYDARIGGGFPTTEEPCTATSCERPDAPPSGFAPVGLGSLNVVDQAPPAAPGAKKVGFRAASISAANRGSWARSGRFGLQVTVDAATTVTATARTSSGKQAARAQRSLKAAGKLTLSLRLSKASVAELRRNGRLKLTVTVSASGAEKATKTTVTLTGRKAAKKTAAKAAKKATKKSAARAHTKGTR